MAIMYEPFSWLEVLATSTPFAFTETTAPTVGPARTVPVTEVVEVAGVLSDPPLQPKTASNRPSIAICLRENKGFDFMEFSLGFVFIHLDV
jgi:hypothetical protein